MKPVFAPRAHRLNLRIFTAGSLLLLSACGGGGAGGVLAGLSGGSGGSGGIGGTGLTSTGTVDGTGSIFVNGVRFDVDSAEIFIDGEPASESQLGLGMVVTVSGTVADDGTNGVAERVDYDPQLKGAVMLIERNADNSSARLTILGQTAIVERTSTVFEDISFDALALGDFIEVSGYLNGGTRLRATRVSGEDEVNGEVKLSGLISNLQGQSFTIGKQQIDATNATIGDLPDDTLSNDLLVEVEGELIDGVVRAFEVEGRGTLAISVQVDDQLTVKGSVSSYDGVAGFVVEGLPITGADATFNTAGLPFQDGLVVEVNGVWDGDQLVASEVSVRRGRIEIEAQLTAVSGTALSFQFGSDEITVSTNSRTLFDDDRDEIEYLKISDLAIGDYLEVEALDSGGALVATRVDRNEDQNESELQAPVESFVEGVRVTMLGVTFNVSQAEFENVGGDDISSAVFFANLKPGALLSVSDSIPSDGFAEEVEFEFAAAVDSELEFLDDDEERIETSNLPAKVLAYLEANFPRASIAFSKRDADEIEVYLTDGTEIVFDRSGNFLESELDDDDDDDD